jgi:hypothetical protein
MGTCESKECSDNIDIQQLKKYLTEYIEIYCVKDLKYSCMVWEFIAGFSEYIFRVKNYTIPNQLPVLMAIINDTFDTTYSHSLSLKGMVNEKIHRSAYMYISGLRIKQMP